VPAPAVDYMKLALLVQNGGVVPGDKGVRQHQVAVLQPSDGEGRVRNIDLFLTGIVDQQQSSAWDCFGHKRAFRDKSSFTSGVERATNHRGLPCGKAALANAE
jgi:hypothetical protein